MKITKAIIDMLNRLKNGNEDVQVISIKNGRKAEGRLLLD